MPDIVLTLGAIVVFIIVLVVLQTKVSNLEDDLITMTNDRDCIQANLSAADKQLFRLNLQIVENTAKYATYRYLTKLDIGKYCCWVHEYGGYFAYCHKDGRLMTRTGKGNDTERTWSSVGVAVLERNNIII